MKTNELLLTLFLALNSYTWAQTPSPPSGYQWQLVEEDNFNGTNLNTTMWGYGSTPWDSENQSSCTWIAPADTYLNGSGSLVLRSRSGSFVAPSGASFPYTSGWAWTKQWRTYGYIEIRASFPNNRGAWPAFWMLQDGWPPEIDIAEFRGAPKNYMTQAYYDGSWYSNTEGGDYTGWHTYGLEWSQGLLKYYIDGNLIYTHTGSTVPSSPMYVILSNGTDCADTDGSGFSNYFNIDYYRWYQPVPQNGGGTFTGTYEIVNRKSGKSLHTLNASTVNGAQVVQYEQNGSSASRWTINEVSTGVYNIIHSASGKYADINGASTSTGANNIIWPSNGGANQKWNIVDQGDGYYQIINVNSGLLLDISGASTANNANNIQWTDNGGYNQDWSFVSVSSSTLLAVENEVDVNTCNFNIFPNPAQDVLHIILPNDYIEDAKIIIYNIQGQVVYNKDQIVNNIEEINISHLSSGIYLFKITKENKGSLVSKFIKK